MKIMGFVIFCAHKWHDILLVRKYKSGRPPCGHNVIFCSCSLTYLRENTMYERPFCPSIELERTKLGQTEVFTPVPAVLERTLVNIGLKVMAIICAAINEKPTLPKTFSSFTISKIYWNKRFCYILGGRKITWGHTYAPSNHVVWVLESSSPLMTLIINQSHQLVGCNQGQQ